MTETQKEALERIAAAAVECERSTGCPAELSAAQCILESAWLARAPGNNVFGIKASARHAQTQLLPTWEVIQGEKVNTVLRFAAYDSLAECFEDHARLITAGGAYRSAWSQYKTDRDLANLMTNIARVYATDPEYGKKVQKVATMPDVQAAVAAERRKGMIRV